jgi:hypothetical protein
MRDHELIPQSLSELPRINSYPNKDTPPGTLLVALYDYRGDSTHGEIVKDQIYRLERVVNWRGLSWEVQVVGATYREQAGDMPGHNMTNFLIKAGPDGADHQPLDDVDLQPSVNMFTVRRKG